MGGRKEGENKRRKEGRKEETRGGRKEGRREGRREGSWVRKLGNLLVWDRFRF